MFTLDNVILSIVLLSLMMSKLLPEKVATAPHASPAQRIKPAKSIEKNVPDLRIMFFMFNTVFQIQRKVNEFY